MPDTYRAEVINPGDAASKLAHEICVASYANSPLVEVVPLDPNNFRGAVGFHWKPGILKEMSSGFSGEGWRMLEVVENDGAGGKPQFFTLLNDERAFEGLGWEIITMTADDLARRGAMPAVIDNEMNVKRVTKANFRFFEAAMRGYGKALAETRLVNITGETAVMKHQITAFCDDRNDDEQLILTWGASCVGLLHRDTYVNPANIKPNMAIVAFSEKGYRCNGGTFLTNLITHNWKLSRGPEALAFVRQLTVPSQSYALCLNRLVGWQKDGTVGRPLANIAGIAHITGGGVWGKFREMLPEGVGARLYGMPEPPAVLLQAQQMSVGTPYEIPDLDCYGTFHGGCGAMVICPVPEYKIVTECAADHGIKAAIAGLTTESNNRQVDILSHFREARWLSSDELPQS